ncbi:hypothetical protein scyTo_0016884 [Scyliorhinus torazame]|uniref:Uncharacterized protein n=1 Tax=Scyliorhinus torazame TaxID=75743 RepID=A0A401Q0F7_SCYTO|nr:hypothetical protein [Scyliorhinus torazame]
MNDFLQSELRSSMMQPFLLSIALIIRKKLCSWFYIIQRNIEKPALHVDIFNDEEIISDSVHTKKHFRMF